jgi:hypothetical protein
MSSSSTAEDVEKGTAGSDHAHLTNDEVKSFSWKDVTVTVKDRTSKQPINLLSNVSGMIEAGEMMALMGPRYAHSIITQATYKNLTERNTVAPAKQLSSTSSPTAPQSPEQPSNKPFV